uniref:L3MBTL histone methyl-lysine binding protein 1b n=1 Tax=Oncorhynchus mykiss TaxID=8022 RepID=A0A8C7RYN3_ONCMY
MTDTPPSDGPSQGAEFDMMGALDWQDGIATLPGSDIKFRMTEFGTLEIVTEPEVKESGPTPQNPAQSKSPTPPPEAQSESSAASSGPMAEEPRAEVGPEAEGGPRAVMASCRSCGGSGPLESFLQGKYCSSICVQPSSGRSSPRERREREGGEGGLGKRVRKKRKIYMDSEVMIEYVANAGPEKHCDVSKAVKGRRAAKLAKLVTAPPNKKRPWSWPSYMEEEKAIAAPLKLFKEHQSFPQSRNAFKVGMKLEGLDPCHPSLFCVLSVAEIQGYRVRLHFDGYPECYDFWVNADTWDVKPAGWCEKMGHKLLLPKGCKDGEFNWNMYVKNCRGQLAPKHLFKSLNTSVTPSGFRAGMKLEAVDKKNPYLICVASIAAAVDNRLLIHFDNWDDTYDYWCDASSPYIHPVGYCEEAELTLTTPAEYKHPRSFSWDKYMEETGTQAAPARAFKLRPCHGFQAGMKLEAVDKRNPMLIRVATIAEVEDHRLRIHFDGWSEEYDYWVDADCPDLHPVGWCQKTSHPLQHPSNGSTDMLVLPGQGCPTPGCNGVGHIRGPRYGTHYTGVSCPYSEMNLNREGQVPDRLSGERPMTLSGPHHRGRRPDPPPHTQTNSPTTPEQPEPADDSPQTRYVSAPVPKYLKLHVVKQESGDGKDSLSLQQALHESVFSPGGSSSPPHRVALCWDKHCQLLPEVLGLTAKRVATWTADEVASFVKGLPGCKEHAATFRTEQMDGEAFLLLTQADIVKILSIKLGPALKIYNAILMLKNADEE